MRQRNWIIGIATLLFLSATTLAYAQEKLSPNALKHQKLGLSCQICHNTDKPTEKAPSSTCLKCHGDGKGKVKGAKVKTYTFDDGSKKKVNVHQSHAGEVECAECHKTHVPSVNHCNQCHAFKDMPLK